MLSSTHKLPTHSDAAQARLRLLHRRSWSGVTLVEMLLVVVIVAVVMAAMAPCIRAVRQGWQVNDRRSEVLQNARVGMAEMTRILRQLNRLSSVSGPADTSGYVEFYDKNGVLMRFELGSQSGYLDYGPPGNLSTLAGPVSSLTFTCYDIADDLLSAPVDVSQVRSVEANLTVTDAEAHANAITVSSKVFLRKDIARLVINEIMYNPKGSDNKHEWIELCNSGGPVDVAGWTLTSLDNQGDPDILEANDFFGTGSTTIPTGGYAVITDKDTEVYEEVLKEGGFEKKKIGKEWKYSGGWSTVKDGDSYEGDWKVARNGAGWIYQEQNLSDKAASAFFSCWEKTPSSTPGETGLIITIRDKKNVVLATLYNGPMHSSWTRHTADLTPYIGGKRRIYFETGSTGTYWIDDVSMSWSYVDKDATRLQVDDNDLGGKLKDNSDTITLIGGGQVVDIVTYQDDWGGDGNNRTLERVSVTGDSMDPANWEEGPKSGTPGRINEASQP